jgi:RNA methyltransferase, TrmH family
MITSVHNSLIKRVRDLQNRRERRREGVFLIEGEKEILAALRAKVEIEMILFCPEILGGNALIKDEDELSKRLGSGETALEAISETVYAKLAYRETTGGLIAMARTPQRSLEDIRLSKNPLLLVLVGVEKPGNVGAILRTADAAGVDAVIVCDEAVDLYNPNVVRASLGALFTITAMQADTGSLAAWLRRHNIKTIATSPDAKLNYTAADYTGPVAVVVGAEHEGLSGDWLAPPVETVKIPMLGAMDSLNVSTAAAIILYEAIRQRRR